MRTSLTRVNTPHTRVNRHKHKQLSTYTLIDPNLSGVEKSVQTGARTTRPHSRQNNSYKTLSKQKQTEKHSGHTKKL